MKKADLAQTIIYLKERSSSTYEDLKTKFLFHTNKIEGSTFSFEEIQTFIQKDVVTGRHPWNDVVETKNSIRLFDYIIEDYQAELSVFKLREYHQLLKQNTKDDLYGQAGRFKNIPNAISTATGEIINVAQPHEVPGKIEHLLATYNECQMTLQDMAEFHLAFETIHPFVDGNGRIGRFLLLKQCLLNNEDPVYIHEGNADEYRKGLYEAQKNGNINLLLCVFQQGQADFAKEFPIIQDIRLHYQQEIQAPENKLNIQFNRPKGVLER